MLLPPALPLLLVLLHVFLQIVLRINKTKQSKTRQGNARDEDQITPNMKGCTTKKIDDVDSHLAPLLYNHCAGVPFLQAEIFPNPEIDGLGTVSRSKQRMERQFRMKATIRMKYQNI